MNWFARFRISNALDNGRAAAHRYEFNPDDDARRFARKLDAVDRALRRTPGTPEPDPALHSSIMRTIRAARAEARPKTERPGWFAWIPAAGVAAAAAVVCFALLPRDTVKPIDIDATGAVTMARAESVGASVALMEKGGQMTKAMPDMVMSPLSNEWAHVDQDMRSATRTLLASFP